MDKELLNERRELLAEAKTKGPEGRRIYQQDEKELKRGNTELRRKLNRLTA